MRVVVTGSSGLVGSSLVPLLLARGDDVVTLVRRHPRAPHESQWDPASGHIEAKALAGADGVVHLAGAGVGDHRWTPAYKRTILRSRVDGTDLLCRTLAKLSPTPRVLVSASGVDYYPDSPDEMDEQSPPGRGFLADVTRAWEQATTPASDAGIMVSHIRSGLILAADGGVLQRLRLLIRAGLAGPVAGGRQWWSWISLTDHVRAIARLLEGDVPGPVNLTSPEPLPQRDFMRTLAAAAHRPAVLPVPGLAVRVAVGQFAEVVAASHRVRPARLTSAGFTYDHPTLAEAAEVTMRR